MPLLGLDREPNWAPCPPVAPIAPETGELVDLGLAAANAYLRRLWLRARCWPTLFVAGLWLFLHAGWRTTRMRNVWLVLLLFAALQAYHQTKIVLLMKEPPSANSSFARAVEVAVSTQYQSQWTHPDYPKHLLTYMFRGIQRPLNSRFPAVQEFVTALSNRIFGRQDPYRPPVGPRLSFEILLANLIYAALTAGVFWWIVLALQGQPLDVRSFWNGVTRAIGPIYCWFLLLEAVRLLITGVEPFAKHARLDMLLIQGLVFLLLFPFAFVPFTIVGRGASIASAFAASVRVFASRLAILLGFLIAFRVAWEVVYVLAGAVNIYANMVVASWAGKFLLYAVSYLAASVPIVLLCTAFMLLVLRTEQRPAGADLATQAAEG